MTYKIQGGVKNYLGNQKMVKAPLHWQSSPDHPETELAYITQKEKDLLVKKDLHGSLKGGVNRGPSGIMSLNGWGSKDESGKEVGMSGAATSAAESGKHTSDTLAAGLSNKDLQEYRSGAIAAGAGQTVNPGWFGSRNRVSKEELARAKAFAPQAYRATRGSRFGIGNLLGGLAGLVMGIPGLGLGITALRNLPKHDTLSDWWGSRKTWSGDDEEEIILSNFQRNPVTGKYEYVKRENPEYYNDLGNEFALGTTSDPFSNTVGTTQGKGIPYTNQFTTSGSTYPVNQNFTDTMTTYTDAIEQGKDIDDDEQLYIDNQIVNRRFP